MTINKKTFILFNIVLIILEVVLVYLMIDTFLTKDLISPSEVKLDDYIEMVNN